MVGYGESLVKARRDGWENAYLDYRNLKSLLEEVERNYKACNDATATATAKTKDGELEALLESGLIDASPDVDYHALEDKAHEHSDLFLRTLRKQVEKVSLFALSRQGELADAAGSLRFNPYVDGLDEAGSSGKRTPSPLAFVESGTIRHDSKSSTDSYGSTYHSHSDSNSNSSFEMMNLDSDEPSMIDELAFLLPQINRRMTNNMSNSSLRLRESLDTAPRPMFTGKAVLQAKQSRPSSSPFKQNIYAKANDRAPAPVPDGNGEWAYLKDDEESEMPALDPYTLVAVELLHLLRFICVNAMAVRKILKKYDKVIRNHAFDRVEGDYNDDMLRHELNTIPPFMTSFKFDSATGPDAHLQQLANSDSIAAITSSLLKASIKTRSMNSASMEKFLIQDEALLRFKCAIDCIDILREYANVVNQPFPAFLSRRAMIVTGYNLGGIEGMKQRALEVLLTFDPDTILMMDKLELSEWQQRCWQYTFTSAGNKMRHTSFDMLEDADAPELKLAWGGVDAWSMRINLTSTLLYTVNYYIIAPTANTYVIYLGARGAFGSSLIGASSFAAIFAAFLYSFWYSKLSFKSALIFSSICPIIGNLAYIVSLPYKSMKLALLGRVLVGFGSAEVLNRQVISACVHFNIMTVRYICYVYYIGLHIKSNPYFSFHTESECGIRCCWRAGNECRSALCGDSRLSRRERFHD